MGRSLSGITGEVMPRNYGWKTLSYFLMVLFTLLTIGPLIWLLYSSFKPHAAIVRNPLALPTGLYYQNYVTAWKIAHLGILIPNSVIYSSVATVLTVLFALAAGYGLAKFGYRVSKVFYAFFILGLLVTVHSVLVPLFVMEIKAGIGDTRFGVILPYIAFGLPFMVFLAHSYIRGIPDSLQEAAVIDGASYLKIFRDIIAPVATPVTATMIIFSFLSNWNEFILVLVLTSREAIRSLPAGVLSFTAGRTANYGQQFAVLVISTAPMIVFYVLFHNQLARGFAAGALKE
jgi:raffinose/stachyose/melibiose transport system permease protein